ncbi:hypothetical protein GIB67_022121 [Kingdonia uniflora]|uniref:Uncharacterized protein n=1 Tax=Kingdonia uniflora TaxID=39325 RepID=A0A7J7LXT1_9MAGN|nr:hypothetical protein GIB67_022121 [Kingdonia uniflora]
MELDCHRKPRKKESLAREIRKTNSLISGDEFDPWTAWAYKPRTLTLLFIGACLLIWASGALDPENVSSADVVTSVKSYVRILVSRLGFNQPHRSWEEIGVKIAEKLGRRRGNCGCETYKNNPNEKGGRPHDGVCEYARDDAPYKLSRKESAD